MALDLARLIVSLEAQTAQYERQLQRTERKLNRFERRQRRGLQRITRQWKTFAAAVGGFVGAGFLVRAGRQALDYADNLSKVSDRLGITTEALSELAFAGQISGVQFRQLELGIQRLVRRVSQAADGTGEAVGALQELGIEAAVLERLPIDRQLEIIADGMQRLELQTDRVRIAQKLFDSEGVALVQVLQDGSEGVRQLREEARRLGVTLDDDAAQAAVAANDSLTRLDASLDALTRNITISAAPALTRLADGLNNTFFGANEATDAVSVAWREVQRLTRELDNLPVQAFDALDIGGQRIDPGQRDRKLDELAEAYRRLAAAQAEVQRVEGIELIDIDQLKARTDLAQERIGELFDAFERRSIRLEQYSLERRFDDARESILEASEALDDFFDEQDRAADEAARAAEEADRAWERLGLQFSSAFEDAVIQGGKLREVLRGILQDIARIALRKVFTEPLGGAITGIFGGNRAAGGPVSAGVTYRVNENKGRGDPEFFVPRVPGTVVPMSKTGRGGFTYNINVSGGLNEAQLAQLIRPALAQTIELTKQSIREDSLNGVFL